VMVTEVRRLEDSEETSVEAQPIGLPLTWSGLARLGRWPLGVRIAYSAQSRLKINRRCHGHRRANGCGRSLSSLSSAVRRRYRGRRCRRSA
jgi:hypothetical protein